MSLLAEPAEKAATTGRPRPDAVAALAGLLAMLCLGAGLVAGVVIGRHTAPSPPLPLLQPDAGAGSATPDNSVAAQRAIALVIGQTRAADAMTFDQWYRARLNRLAPDIRFQYIAQLNGNALCGFWQVVATVVPGPVQPGDPANTDDMLNQHGAIATIDELSGDIVAATANVTTLVHFGSDGCVAPGPPTAPSWYDDFRSGKAP